MENAIERKLTLCINVLKNVLQENCFKSIIIK
jgi:hypothetical protein